MFYQLRRTLSTRRFEFAIRQIGATPPLRARPAPLRVVTMLTTRHLPMYLLAIKSFYRHLPGGEVVVLDDGSLTPGDHAVLRRHIAPLTLLRLDEVELGPCPRGGCWERLLRILEMSRDTYTIQLDSDVLTVDAIPEVVAAVEANTSFTLGSDADLPVMDLEAAVRLVADGDERETQICAERALAHLPAGFGRRYVRGSAGFAGFARGAVSRADAEAFSAAMQARMGARWTEWGTEQVASNYLVANAPGGAVLPWPKYCCAYPDTMNGPASLLHFLGTWRFRGGVYATRARRVIGELMRAGPA